MEIRLQIDEKDIGKLVRNAEPIMCSGASHEATPVPAFVEVVRAPRDNYSDTGESYVLCPRLVEFSNGTTIVMRCDEIHIDTYDRHSREQLQKSRLCPYLKPARTK